MNLDQVWRFAGFLQEIKAGPGYLYFISLLPWYACLLENAPGHSDWHIGLRVWNGYFTAF